MTSSRFMYSGLGYKGIAIPFAFLVNFNLEPSVELIIEWELGYNWKIVKEYKKYTRGTSSHPYQNTTECILYA